MRPSIIVPCSSTAGILQQMACHSTTKLSSYIVTTSKSTFMFTKKDSFSDFLIYGIALNSFAVVDDGCFHIRNDTLVECHVINKCAIPHNNVLQKLLSIMCLMDVRKSHMMGHAII